MNIIKQSQGGNIILDYKKLLNKVQASIVLVALGFTECGLIVFPDLSNKCNKLSFPTRKLTAMKMIFSHQKNEINNICVCAFLCALTPLGRPNTTNKTNSASISQIKLHLLC